MQQSETLIPRRFRRYGPFLSFEDLLANYRPEETICLGCFCFLSGVVAPSCLTQGVCAQALGCTCITISHRPALMAFHDMVLNLDGLGGWNVRRNTHHGAQASTRITGVALSLAPLSWLC